MITEQKPARTVADLKALLQRAKEKKQESGNQDAKDRIADLEAELKMSESREHTVLMEVKVLKEQLEEEFATLAETKQNRDALLLINEDPNSIIEQLEEMIEAVKQQIDEKTKLLTSIETQRATHNREIQGLRDSLSISVVKQKPAVQSPIKRPMFFDSKERQERTQALLGCCRDTIKSLFKQCEEMKFKMEAYLQDKNARSLFLDEAAARIKILITEPEYHNLNDAEQQILKWAHGALVGCSKTYEAHYLEPLSQNQRPTGFSSWSDYHKDCVKRKTNYFSPTKVADPKPCFGLISPAPKTELQEAIKEALVVMSKPVVFSPPKPKAEKNSTEKLFGKLIEESGVLKRTSGLRVAMVAGLAEKNEPMREFIEDSLGFKRLTWYDGRNNNDLVTSIKNGGIDLLLAIPDWHKGYKYFFDLATKNKISTLALTEHNKFKLCQQIGKYFGCSISLPV